MFDWFSAHQNIIDTLTNVGMLLVWVGYLQLFFLSYRRQRRSEILINRGGGNGLRARCLISNMSAEAIYVESIIVTLREGEQEIPCPVTDLEDLEDEQMPSDPKQTTRQGPLGSGSYMEIGSFRHLLDRAMAQAGRGKLEPSQLSGSEFLFEVHVIADYTSESLLVAARRTFEIVGTHDQVQIRSTLISTEQIRSRPERFRIQRLLMQQL